MAERVIIPKQGLQMTEGTITKWLVKEGDRVEKGRPLFEMETDKQVVIIYSPVSGALLKILRFEGETVPVAETIAFIGEPGEDISGFCEFHENKIAAVTDTNNENYYINVSNNEEKKSANKRIQRVFATPRARMLSEEYNVDINEVKGTGTEGIIIERDIREYIDNQDNLPKATPLARKIAEQSSMDLSGITGTGSHGKITKSDVLDAINAKDRMAELHEERKGRIVPFAGMRKVISERMMYSLHSMAQANHKMKVDMTEFIRLREKLVSDNNKVSFTDIFVKVVSKALLEFPMLNSSLTDDGILIRDYVNIGIAVSVENGLIVPVIKGADLMTLEEISSISAELIDKARKGMLVPEEYTGGTFTITNLGMFDIDEFTAIINPPESAILAVGKIDRMPVAEGDSVVIKPITVLSLTYDHRIIDGAPAAKFLQRVKQLLQNPYLLI